MVIRKKVEWVFVFRTALDLQKFVRLVESVTNPDYGLNLENIPQPQSGALKGMQSDPRAGHQLNGTQNTLNHLADSVWNQSIQ